MIAAIRKRLAWKLFFSYIIVILIGVIVLATAAELTIPSSFQRHLAAMGMMMDQMMGDASGGMGMDLNSDLFANFRRAVNEALFFAALTSAAAAVIVSILISRRIVAPVREMMTASQRIADGHYDERVHIPGSLEPEQMDELSNLAVSFNQMAARLDRTETLRRQLIADVAHELRTPLSTVKGSMEALIDGVLPTEAATFQKIHREAERMQRLVQDLQELSRVEAGAYQLQLVPIQPSTLIDAAHTRLENQFKEKGVALEIDVPPDLPPVNADEDRISQVLLNLLGNALQYTPSNGRVRVSAEAQGDEVLFGIEDSGIGIATEHLPHIFTRFYRVDKSRSRVSGGSGIGLTISKHIVEAHGGRIWAESAGAGAGSIFQFTLLVPSA